MDHYKYWLMVLCTSNFGTCTIQITRYIPSPHFLHLLRSTLSYGKGTFSEGFHGRDFFGSCFFRKNKIIARLKDISFK